MIGWKWDNTVWYCHHTPWTETGGYQCQFLAIVLFFFSSFLFDMNLYFILYIYTPYILIEG